jgi:hypothetical protein
MPILPSAVPAEAVNAAEGSLMDEVVQSALTAFRVPRVANLLSLSLPHRIAALSVEDIRVDVAPREVAQLGNWRFLLYGRKAARKSSHWTISGAVTVSFDEDEEEYKVADLEQGLLVTRFEQAVRHAESRDRVRDGAYEVLLLIAPSIYVSALWLHDQKGREDLFLALPYTPAPLAPAEPTSSEEFMQSLVASKAKLRTA